MPDNLKTLFRAVAMVKPDSKMIAQVMLYSQGIVTAEILTPVDYIGNVMKICQEKRGKYKSTSYLSSSKVQLIYELPLGEILFDKISSAFIFPL